MLEPDELLPPEPDEPEPDEPDEPEPDEPDEPEPDVPLDELEPWRFFFSVDDDEEPEP